MEAPSAHGHRWRVPWQGLLLAVSLCTIEILPNNGGLVLESRMAPDVNSYIFLKLDPIPRTVHSYTWLKGDNRDPNNQIASYVVSTGIMSPGPAYTGREKLYPIAALKVWNISREDSGCYTVEALMTNNKKYKASIYLFILEPLTATSLEEFTSTVQVNDELVIICLTSDTSVRLHWLFNGRKLQEKENKKLSSNNKTVHIKNIMREDAGKYQCMYAKVNIMGTSERLKLEVI
ncbi:carcinoembryonic antigen-related cell adhesion molecule 21-like [Talpa occidentalis]|uniref:carcinoembryonic antigen-related cell adhesion molecule 21-like n=1 Tax=Talpa occidentalis TaxID=50954 RepID=UPI00188E0E2F|nr:carcinoembryonic antigen-related cell adhesion molecule 21-like [Talpa occidentalis]